MSRTPKPSRCRDCALYDLAYVTGPAGRVRSHGVAKCGWVSTEPKPLSVRGYKNHGFSVIWMGPNEGDGCPCFVKREAAP